MELVEWRFQVVGLNALLVEEDALVEGFVEIPADLVGAVNVTRLGVGHEVERAEKDVGAYREHCARVFVFSVVIWSVASLISVSSNARLLDRQLPATYARGWRYPNVCDFGL